MEPAPKRLRLLPPLELHISPRSDLDEIRYEADAATYQAGGYGENSQQRDEEDDRLRNQGEDTMTSDDRDEIRVREFYKDYDEQPDPVLEERRRLLATKLKSKFEAIFEKYEKDFTGIGDEIDLRTGRFIVDNGHLADMEDERDDGTMDGERNNLSTLAADQEENAESEDDSDAMEDEEDSIGSMDDDDMVLYETNDDTILQSNPAVDDTFQNFPQKENVEPRKAAEDQLVLPSDSQIMAQFGGILGPQIIRYVAEQRQSYQSVTDDSSIEPAWRVPAPSIATPGKRPVLKSILSKPENGPLLRPKVKKPKHYSVWAPQMPRGRPRKDGSEALAIMKGQSFLRGSTWYSNSVTTTTTTRTTVESADGQQPSRKLKNSMAFSEEMERLDDEQEPNALLDDDDEYIDDEDYEDDFPDSALQSEPEVELKPYRPQSKPKKKAKTPKAETFRDASAWAAVPKDRAGRKAKTTYTYEDDEMLLQWVAEIEAQGVDYIFSHQHWKKLEEKNPRHTYLSWLDRYRKNYYNKKRSYKIEARKLEDEDDGSLPDSELLDEIHSPGTNAATLETRLPVVGERDRLFELSLPNSNSKESFQPDNATNSRSSARRATKEKISDTISSASETEGMENIDPRLLQDSWISAVALTGNESTHLPPSGSSFQTQCQPHATSQVNSILEPPVSTTTSQRTILPGDKPRSAMKQNTEHSKPPEHSKAVNEGIVFKGPTARRAPVSQQQITIDSTLKEREPRIFKGKSVENFSRNIIDASYEFSDDDDEPHPRLTEVDRSTNPHTLFNSIERDKDHLHLKSGEHELHADPNLPPFSAREPANTKSPISYPRPQNSVPPSQSPQPSKSPATTNFAASQVARSPALATPKTSRPVVREIVDSDDVDELSMGGDELDLFSARPSRGSSAAPRSQSSVINSFFNARRTPAGATPSGISNRSPQSLRLSGSPRTPASSTR